MMDKMISAFPDQIEEAIKIGRNARIQKDASGIQNLLICGMGGSGIGGDFMVSWLKDKCPVPVIVNKGYDLPAFVGEQTLVVLSSYSGNTEETLNCLKSLEDNPARTIVISSGGEMIETAENKGYEYIELPSDWASPRACLGYSLVSQLFVLYHKGLIDESFVDQLESAVELLKKDREQIREKAEHMARMISGKFPVIYSAESVMPVGLRWRQQLNENAKILAWHNTFPELNHNELVGWKGVNDHLALLVLRNKNDHGRTQIRMNISKEIFIQSAGTYIEIWSKGDSLIEQSLYLVHLGDWLSWYLSDIKGEDAVEVKVIDYLKSELAKF